MNPASPEESQADYIGMAETAELEFKCAVWNGGEECAKDVAALANATGGVIIVGVVCGDDGIATGYANWRTSSSQEAIERRLMQYMEHWLRPRDFVDAVRLSVASARDGHEVLVVSVPPSPSLIAVASQDSRDRRATRFAAPIRVNAETRYMEFDEMVRRVADAYRGMRLQIEELLAEERGVAARVRLTSPVFMHQRGGLSFLPRSSSLGHDGHLEAVLRDGVQVRFDAQFRYPAAGSASIVEIRDSRLLVPFGLLSAFWRDEKSGVVWLGVRAQVLYEDGALMLHTP